MRNTSSRAWLNPPTVSQLLAPRPAHHAIGSPRCPLLLLLALALGLLVFAPGGNATAQTITTVAGGGMGEGGAATSAGLNASAALALDASGNLFIADTGNHRIRRVAAGTGVITTVAGTGSNTFAGDGGPATSANLFSPVGVAVDATGNLFIAHQLNNRIRKVAAGTGIITTVAETGELGPPSHEGPASVALDATGNLFVANRENQRVRKVAGAGGEARPAITAPSESSRVSRGSLTPVSVAWTAVPGATQYGFEHTGPNQQFANPNGTGPDPVNGFGGAGGGFVLSAPYTSFAVTLLPSTSPGTYQVRVGGLAATTQVVGVFSDAVTVVVE